MAHDSTPDRLRRSSLAGSVDAVGHSPSAAETAHAQLARALHVVRIRARLLLLVGASALLLAIVVSAVVVFGAADFALRTPAWMRMGLWIAGGAAIVIGVRRLILPAAAFSPTLTEVALRVERSEPGRRAGLAGILASGLELGSGQEASRATGLVTDAGTKFAPLPVRSLLIPARSMRSVGLLVLALSVTAAAWAASPSLASIGIRRVLAPWAGVEWPKRTEVADATRTAPHARGSGFLLRALLSKNRDLFARASSDAEARVIGRFRLVVDGTPAPTRRVLLTKQNNPLVHSPSSPHAEPNGDAESHTGVASAAPLAPNASLFEYLIEPWGLSPASEAATPAAAKVELEYWFESDDDSTSPARVLLVEPPAVTQASLALTPPAYYAQDATTPGTGSPLPPPRTLDLGIGSDERAAPKPILRGASVELTLRLNKPIPQPTQDQRESWISQTLGPDCASLARAAGIDSERRFEVLLTAQSLTARWVMDQPVRINVSLLDEHGIANVETYSYYLDALEDKPPQASVTLPTEDKPVLPTATVEIRGEGRDDLGLHSIALWSQIARPPTDSSGVPAEPVSEPVELLRQPAPPTGRTPSAETPSTPGMFSVPSSLPARLEVGLPLHLASLNLSPGDEVWLTARAIDGYSLGGQTHDPVVSSVRRLRIISEEQFLEQVWAELAGVRRSAISMAEEQARLRSETSRNAEASRLERAQAAISERVAREQQALQQLQNRLAENGLQDDDMQNILRDARQSLEQAGESSVNAASQLNDAKQAEQQSGAPDAPSRAAADQSQRQTQRSLEELAQQLDQGEDTWSMKRAVEQLLEDQKSLRNQTNEIGAQTTGRQTKDLSPAQRDALAQAAQQQQGLAQRAAEAIQNMMDAEQNVRKNDPAAADSMSQATRQAQRDQLQEKMEQAAQQVQQNQTNTAQSRQNDAIQSMEQMLDQLRNTAKNRDEVLRRQLASLMDSLDALIRDQEAQVEALAAGMAKGEVAGLDRGMARLHQNTLAVLDEAQQASREVAPVAELIDAAASAQQQAVVALRVEPINADEAQDQETLSLDKLKEAKALAEQLDRDAQNRQAQRQRAELKKAYTEALTQQLALRQETDALVGVEPTRRSRAEARTLAERQRVVQDTLAKLLSENPELAEAVMFSYAHKRLDESMGNAAAALAQGTADRAVTRQQDRAVKVLQSLVQALDDAQQKDDEFRQQQEQQPGNGNQNQSGRTPLVPQAADVKVLRAMQDEALELTREAGNSADSTLVDEAGTLQSELAAQAEALIKKLLERRQRPPGQDAPGNDPASKDDDNTPPAEPAVVPVPPSPPPAGAPHL